VVEKRLLKVEEAYEGPAVDGDANIWLQWSTAVTLDSVVVFGVRLRMPMGPGGGGGIGCCTIGLASDHNFHYVKDGGEQSDEDDQGD